MPRVSNVEKWQTLAIQLEGMYAGFLSSKPNSFMTALPSQQGIHPLIGIDPWHDKFFGPRVCNIVIIGTPYNAVGDKGAQIVNWPPPGYQLAMDRLKAFYPQWAKFELHFWGNAKIIEDVQAADPAVGSEFRQLMNDTFEYIEADCEDMAGYGWEWHGQIKGDPSVSDFSGVLNRFFGL